jgi:hypothetical protein
LEWGSKLKFLQEEAKGATTEDEIPQALRSRPKLNQFQMNYWLAYQEISGSRQYTSSGVAEIPYTEKLAWLNENDITDEDERATYHQMVSALDGAYLEHFYEKSKVK